MVLVLEHCKLLWFWFCARFLNHELQTLSGSWNTVNYFGFGSADPLWELEHCKLLWFWCCARFRKHDLQTLSGSWNIVNYYGFGAAPDFGIMNCRPSLEAGTL